VLLAINLSVAGHKTISLFNDILNEQFSHELLIIKGKGIRSIEYFASQTNQSLLYLSDLLKQEQKKVNRSINSLL
jgi:hypothetical protein